MQMGLGNREEHFPLIAFRALGAFSLNAFTAMFKLHNAVVVTSGYTILTLVFFIFTAGPSSDSPVLLCPAAAIVLVQ